MIETIQCKYCGGKLIPTEREEWLCENCGRYSNIYATDNVHSPTGTSSTKNRCRLTIINLGDAKELDFDDSVKIHTDYDPRATKADEYPARTSIELDGTLTPLFKKTKLTHGDVIEIKKHGSVFQIYVNMNNNRISGTQIKENEPIVINGMTLMIKPISK